MLLLGNATARMAQWLIQPPRSASVLNKNHGCIKEPAMLVISLVSLTHNITNAINVQMDSSTTCRITCAIVSIVKAKKYSWRLNKSASARKQLPTNIKTIAISAQKITTSQMGSASNAGKVRPLIRRKRNVFVLHRKVTSLIPLTQLDVSHASILTTLIQSSTNARLVHQDKSSTLPLWNVKTAQKHVLTLTASSAMSALMEATGMPLKKNVKAALKVLLIMLRKNNVFAPPKHPTRSRGQNVLLVTLLNILIRSKRNALIVRKGRNTTLSIRNANALKVNPLKLRRNVSLVTYRTTSTFKQKNVRTVLRILSITLIDRYVSDAQEINLFSMVKPVLLAHWRSILTSQSKIARTALEVGSMILKRKDVSALRMLHSILVHNAFSAFCQNISIYRKNNAWVALYPRFITHS